MYTVGYGICIPLLCLTQGGLGCIIYTPPSLSDAPYRYRVYLTGRGVMCGALSYGEALQPFAGPGHWHDMDMLLIGNGCITHEEEMSQMA